MIVAVPKDSLTIAGQTLKTFDDVGESGLPVLRRFCGKCGSPIVSHVEAMPDLAFIKAGTLENTSGSAVRRRGGRSTTGCALLPARKMLLKRSVICANCSSSRIC